MQAFSDVVLGGGRLDHKSTTNGGQFCIPVFKRKRKSKTLKIWKCISLITYFEWEVIHFYMDDSDGQGKVWSTDSKDDEVCQPTHGKRFMVREQKSRIEGKCLMLGSTDFESQWYFTDDGVKSVVCFTVKSIKEYAGESEKVINKVHSTLKSLNIHVSLYDSEMT